ncbi:protein PAXX [Brienomyrus brachyistius]|uniref:protein PAXX n=1 Tax=Brienomyrus brachyistius TaxID=42636 RepID=UPI0020B2AE38|nr:protein PAXX [Brienomyrus brachyistius]
MDHQMRSTYCTVVNKCDDAKYLCYFHGKAGAFNIRMTDASDVWSTDFTEDTLTQHMKSFALKSPESYVSKIREACQTGMASVSLEGDSALLHLGGGLSVSLSRLGSPQSRAELQELLFRMAESLSCMGGPAPVSPMKNVQGGRTEFEPRRHQTGPILAVRKRIPGDSLINPGSRSKKSATGVLFDE